MNAFLMIIESLLFGLMTYTASAYIVSIVGSFNNWGEKAWQLLTIKNIALSVITTLWYLISLIREV